MSNVIKIDGTPLKAELKATMTLEEELLSDAPYFDNLMDGRVGELQLALYDMGLGKEANMIEQILWKLVDATITDQRRGRVNPERT